MDSWIAPNLFNTDLHITRHVYKMVPTKMVPTIDAFDKCDLHGSALGTSSSTIYVHFCAVHFISSSSVVYTMAINQAPS